MLIRTPHRALMAVVATFVVAAFSGCAGTSPTSPETTGPTAETAADSPQLAPAVPTVRYDTDCPTLFPASAAATALGSGSMTAKALERDAISPLTTFSTRQVGGLVCSWSNGEPRYIGDHEINPASKSLDLQILPDPDGKFSLLSMPQPDAADVQFGDGSSTGCAGATGICSANVTADGSWLQIQLAGLDVVPGATDADARAQATGLIHAVVDGIPAPKGDAPTAGVVDCTVALPFDDTLSALGVPQGQAAHGTGGNGQYEQSQAAAEYAGAQWCSQGYAQGDGRWVNTDILPGGAWVFQPGVAESSVAKGTEQVSVPGTATPDSYLACEAGIASCTLDMAVGNDWVRVWLSNQDRSSDIQAPSTEQDRSDLLALAAHVVENLS